MECSYGVASINKLVIFLSFVALTGGRGLANPKTDPDYSNALDVAVAYLKSNPLILNDGDDPYIYIQVPVDEDENNGRQHQPVIDIHLPSELLEEIKNSGVVETRPNDEAYIDIQVHSAPFVDIQEPYVQPHYNYGYQQNPYLPDLNPFNQQQNTYFQKQNPYLQQQYRYDLQQYPYIQPQNTYVSEENPYSHQKNPYIHQESPYVHQENPYVHQDNPYVHQEQPYIHQEQPYVHEESPYIYEDVPYIHQEQPYVHEKSPYIYEDVPYVHQEVPYVEEIPQKQVKPYIDIEYTLRVQADAFQAASKEYYLPSEEYSLPEAETSSIPADPMLAYFHAQRLLNNKEQ